MDILNSLHSLHSVSVEGVLKEVLTKELIEYQGTQYVAVTALFEGVEMGCYVCLDSINDNGVGTVMIMELAQ
jgi:hypothetical protein